MKAWECPIFTVWCTLAPNVKRDIASNATFISYLEVLAIAFVVPVQNKTLGKIFKPYN